MVVQTPQALKSRKVFNSLDRVDVGILTVKIDDLTDLIS